MTRVNLIPVKELSDQHLIREYQELPRCIKKDMNLINAPTTYTLGTGHKKWGRRNWYFLLKRYKLLCEEMDFRGFTRNYDYISLKRWFKSAYPKLYLKRIKYTPTKRDIKISRDRIKEKLSQKPEWYKWTKRKVPRYVKML